MKLFLVLSSLLGLISFVPEGDTACCYSTGYDRGGRKACGDCTAPTYYCGRGKCDFFGCKCAGGCRSGGCGRRKRSIYSLLEVKHDEMDAIKMLVLMDGNKDGKVDLGEIIEWRDTHKGQFEHPIFDANVTHEFLQMDADKNGFLTPNEIQDD